METQQFVLNFVKSSVWEERAHRYRLGPDQLGSSSVEKDLETWADVSAGHEQVQQHVLPAEAANSALCPANKSGVC